MKEITNRQKEVAEFIDVFIKENHYSPSLRDISNHFSFSVKAAHDHVQALKKKGIINAEDNTSRTIEIIGSRESMIVNIPVLGSIAAGEPLLSEESVDYYFPISMEVIGKVPKDSKLYALKIKGESMIEDGIMDGDIAILRKTSEAQNGDIVAASINDNYGITLKHFFKTSNRYELHPANKNFEPIYSSCCEVWGKLVMVIRNYDN